MTAPLLSDEAVRHAAVMRECRETLAKNSKTFALAARLLPRDARDRAASLYSYCRRVDDAIDGVPTSAQEHALEALKRELTQLYRSAGAPADHALQAFQAVVRTTSLPERYPSELLHGMTMDVRGTVYQTHEELLLYCHCVAGVVGLMMCHVLGVTRESALVEAAQLGIAMQLTNICRDVAEDFGMGRVYLPRDMLRAHGAPELPAAVGPALPDEQALLTAMARVTGDLLREADRYYEAAEQGIVALPFRAGLAVRAALHMYRAIGRVVAAQGYDPRRGRAVVSLPRKLAILLKVAVLHVCSLPAYVRERFPRKSRAHVPRSVLSFPDDVLSR